MSTLSFAATCLSWHALFSVYLYSKVTMHYLLGMLTTAGLA